VKQQHSSPFSHVIFSLDIFSLSIPCILLSVWLFCLLCLLTTHAIPWEDLYRHAANMLPGRARGLAFSMTWTVAVHEGGQGVCVAAAVPSLQSLVPLLPPHPPAVPTCLPLVSLPLFSPHLTSLSERRGEEGQTHEKGKGAWNARTNTIYMSIRRTSSVMANER